MKQDRLSRYEIIRLRRDIQHQLSAEELDNLIREIYLSIARELRAHTDYLSLSNLAPDSFSSELFIQFSHDQSELAEQLQFVYQSLTGKLYAPPGEQEAESKLENYREALENRILEETSNYQKYINYYQLTGNPWLKDIFFNSLQLKSYHIIRELYFLHSEVLKLVDITELKEKIKEVEGIKEEIRKIETISNQLKEVVAIKEEIKKVQAVQEEIKQMGKIKDEMKDWKRESRKMLMELQERLSKMNKRNSRVK